MRKIILTVGGLILANVSIGQMIERKKIASGVCVSKWDIVMRIENNIDTTTFFYYGYQNKKYTQITDIGSVFLTHQDELIDFANGLKTMSTKENGIQLELNIGSHSLRLYDFSNDIYIEDKDGKYTHITKKQANKFADELILNSKYLRK
jgi:hypothetical protein